jgi:hypothetical protein
VHEHGPRRGTNDEKSSGMDSGRPNGNQLVLVDEHLFPADIEAAANSNCGFSRTTSQWKPTLPTPTTAEVNASGHQQSSRTQDVPCTKVLSRRTPWQTEEEAQEEEDEQVARHQQAFNEVDAHPPDALMATAQATPPTPLQLATNGCLTPYPLGSTHALGTEEDAQGEKKERQWARHQLASKEVDRPKGNVPCSDAVENFPGDARDSRADNGQISGSSRIGPYSGSDEAASLVETRAALVQRIKTFQRQDRQNHWAGFCARQGFSSKDPTWMSNETLKSFLRERQSQATAANSQRSILVDDPGPDPERPRRNEAIWPMTGRRQWHRSGPMWRPKIYHQSTSCKSNPSSPPWWSSSEHVPGTTWENGHEWDHNDHMKQPRAGHTNKQEGRHPPKKSKAGDW